MAHALSIFISHSHEDTAFCQALTTALRGAGADVWYDERDLGADSPMDVIQQELERREIFIVLLSRHAFASRQIRRETVLAYELTDHDPTRMLLPVTVGDIQQSDFDPGTSWLFLADFKRIEASGYQPYPVAEAIGRVLDALPLAPTREATTANTPQPTESVNSLILHGMMLLRQGNRLDALARFERATQLDPNSFSAWGNVGYILNELGRYEQALPALDRAISLNRNDAPTWNNKGWALNGLQRYTEGLAACEQALTLDPTYAYAWNNKGNALTNMQRYDEALAAYEQALILDPKYAHGLEWQGVDAQ